MEGEEGGFVMKIATNTVFSFRIGGSHNFVHLGDEIEGVEMIVLMLSKNWGARHSEKIRDLSFWISQYPDNIPCYIIGCEATIPDMNVWRYRDIARDQAIRELCDLVLKRSESIAVRGEITRTYLIDVLGYPAGQIDIIFKHGSPGNREYLGEFLKKNGLHLGEYFEDMAVFQQHPIVTFHERTRNFDRKIYIAQPQISETETGARLSAEVTIDGVVRTLWSETAPEYRDYLMSERADPFVCVLVPFALRNGMDIVSEAPVTEQFLHNLQEILIPQLCVHDNRLYHSQVIADGDASSLPSGGAIATGMSCGVDSFYTASLYYDPPYKSMKLTHLYCGNYLYGNGGPIYDRAGMVAKDLGLPLVSTGTNINEAVPLPHLFTHFYKTMFGVLSLRKLFQTYFYSTAEDFSHFSLKGNGNKDTAELELMLLYVFSAPDLQIMTGGVKSERLDKTRAICEFPAARKHLNVCLFPKLDVNCGQCEKCRRTLLALDMLEALPLFQGVFPIEDYLVTRQKSFSYLVRQKDSPFLKEVYQHFLRVEPEMMKEAGA